MRSRQEAVWNPMASLSCGRYGPVLCALTAGLALLGSARLAVALTVTVQPDSASATFGIQEAVNKVAATDGEVRVPAGEHVLRSCLRWSDLKQP